MNVYRVGGGAMVPTTAAGIAPEDGDQYAALADEPADSVPIELEPAETETPTGGHDYLSTACYHGVHDHCRSAVNLDGDPKQPGTCKFCSARCACSCHPWTTDRTATDE